MRGCAELSWHAGANYILGLDERAHIQKAKQGEELCSTQRLQVCGFHVAITNCPCANRGSLCMPLHNSHHPLSNRYKDIYFCVLMFGLSLILAAKQTLGPNLRVSVMLACSSPTLETRARVMRLERLTKTNL